MKIIIIFLLVILSFSYSKRILNVQNKMNSIFLQNNVILNNFFKKTGDDFKFKAVERLNKNNKVNLQEKTLVLNNQEISTIHQGWMKYMEINEDAIDVPSCFTKNKVFFLQMSENSGINTLARDNIGYVNIPNEDFFYFELTLEKLSVYNGRNPPYRKLEKSIKLEDLIPQVNLSPCKGGVEDVGNFAEGYCFMLKFVNYSRHFIWELCAESIYEKDKWMNKIMEINSKKGVSSASLDPVLIPPQPAIALPSPGVVGFGVGIAAPLIHSSPGVILHGPSLFDPQSSPSIVTPAVQSYAAAGAYVPAPGLGPVPIVPAGFQAIGPWTPCSRPCGEGIQSRPLDCMDENLCKGRKFQERLCNIQACKEDVENHMDKLKKVADGQWEFLGTWSTCSRSCGGGVQTIERRCLTGNCVGEPVLTQDCNTFVCGQDPKNMLISSTEIFNRDLFDECKLLEGNLMMVMNNEKVLSHVEVNLQTVQIFNKNNPSIPIVIPLNKLSEVRPSVSAPGCFKLVGESSNVVSLCPQNPQATPCDTWIKRIVDFKENCSKKLLNKIENDISTSLEMSKDPNANTNKLSNIQKKVLDDEKLRTTIKEKALESQFEEFKRQTRDLLAKEDAYETKLEQQEKDRLDWEQKKMQETSLKEQQSAQKLLSDLQTLASNDNSYVAKERAIKREMKTLMTEVQTKITSKREKLISKLQRMRTLHEIGEKKAAKELMDMKREMGKKLSNLAKKGTPSQCFTKNLAMINNYCTTNVQDLEMQVECKKPNQFCYICCDTEIGALNKEYQNCCYNKCDEIENSTCSSFNETYHIVNQQVAYLG